MGTLSVQVLAAADPLAGEWLRWTAWHPQLRTVRLVSNTPEHLGLSAEDLHPGLFGMRGLGVSAGGSGADITVVCPSWEGPLPADSGQCLDLRPGATGEPALPELHTPAPGAALAGVPGQALAAALILEPLLRGRVVSPREPIGLNLSPSELDCLRPLLTGHFQLEGWHPPTETKAGTEDSGPVTCVRVPLFEGYSEHDALAAYRGEYRAQPWVRLRREAEVPLGVRGTPACELHLQVLEREDPEIPIPHLGVTARLDVGAAQVARMVGALNLSRGWPALLGLVP